MNFIVYKSTRVPPKAFVEFWAAQYTGYDEVVYEENVGRELTEARLLTLFAWKNGRPLSKAKRESVLMNFAARSGELAKTRQDESAADLLHRFREGGAIWRIFWLHCWQPAQFPIYDQHVHRAMCFVQTGKPGEIPASDPKKIDSYLRSYMPFHAQFLGLAPRLVDKGLWAFGRFLGENKGFPCQAR